MVGRDVITRRSALAAIVSVAGLTAVRKCGDSPPVQRENPNPPKAPVGTVTVKFVGNGSKVRIVVSVQGPVRHFEKIDRDVDLELAGDYGYAPFITYDEGAHFTVTASASWEGGKRNTRVEGWIMDDKNPAGTVHGLPITGPARTMKLTYVR